METKRRTMEMGPDFPIIQESYSCSTGINCIGRWRHYFHLWLTAFWSSGQMRQADPGSRPKNIGTKRWATQTTTTGGGRCGRTVLRQKSVNLCAVNTILLLFFSSIIIIIIMGACQRKRRTPPAVGTAARHPPPTQKSRCQVTQVQLIFRRCCAKEWADEPGRRTQPKRSG